jgi:hypothetical protein
VGIDVTREQEAALIASAMSRPGSVVGRSMAEMIAGAPANSGGTPLAIEAPPAADCAEEDFQAKLLAYAHQRGWLIYHPYRSLKSKEGYPDLTMVRLKRVVFAELKSETGKESNAQTEWRRALERVGGHVEAYLWRPSDWAGIAEVLR